MEKIKEDDFLLGEEPLIEIFGREFLEKLKKEKPQEYINLRGCAAFMPSDIIRPKQAKNLEKKFSD